MESQGRRIESTVSTNTSKPTEAQVDAKKATQDQQIAQSYSPLATTYDKLQVDAAIQVVNTAISARPTVAEVSTQITTANTAKD